MTLSVISQGCFILHVGRVPLRAFWQPIVSLPDLLAFTDVEVCHVLITRTAPCPVTALAARAAATLVKSACALSWTAVPYIE